HVACTTEESSHPAISAVHQLRAIRELKIRPTHFGPSINGTSTRARLRQAPSMLLLPGHLLGLARYIPPHRIQVIHGTEKPRDCFYGVLLGKVTGARSVVHMHVNYGEWQSSSVKWALRHADAIVGVSHFTSNSIVAAGLPAERVFTVHNSLDAARWDPT